MAYVTLWTYFTVSVYSSRTVKCSVRRSVPAVGASNWYGHGGWSVHLVREGDISHFVVAGAPRIRKFTSKYFPHSLLSVYCTT